MSGTASCWVAFLLAWPGVVLCGQDRSLPAIYEQARKDFRPAQFNGIRMGSSSVREVEKLLGPPLYSGIGEDGMMYLGYRNVAPVAGDVEFTVDPKTRVVLLLAIATAGLRLSEAAKIYGQDFVRLRWTSYACDPLSDAGFTVLDPNGDIEKVVFPRRGVFAVPIAPGSTEIMSIIYARNGLKADKSPCPAPGDPKAKGSAKRKTQ